MDEGGGGESHVAHQMASNFTQLSVELHDAAGRDKTIASLAPANILFLFSLFLSLNVSLTYYVRAYAHAQPPAEAGEVQGISSGLSKGTKGRP